MKYLSGGETLTLAAEKCTACGRCVEVCPHEVLIISDACAKIVRRDRCMECGACARNCAFGAIQVNAGVGCAVALINAMLTGGEPNCDCSPSGSTGTSCC